MRICGYKASGRGAGLVVGLAQWPAKRHKTMQISLSSHFGDYAKRLRLSHLLKQLLCLLVSV